MKGTSLEGVAKVTDGEVDSEKLSTKGAVSCLSWFQFLREESDWLPVVIDLLLQNTTDGNIGGVYHDVQWRIDLRMSEHGDIGESGFNLLEGSKRMLVEFE